VKIDSYNDHRSAPFLRACWLVKAPPTLLGPRSRHCHGINYAHCRPNAIVVESYRCRDHYTYGRRIQGGADVPITRANHPVARIWCWDWSRRSFVCRDHLWPIGYLLRRASKESCGCSGRSWAQDQGGADYRSRGIRHFDLPDQSCRNYSFDRRWRIRKNTSYRSKTPVHIVGEKSPERSKPLNERYLFTSAFLGARLST